jgi:hypothetical protein
MKIESFNDCGVIMLRKAGQALVAGAVTKYTYDKGYEAGKEGRKSQIGLFFSNCKNSILDKIEEQLPSEHRIEFRKDVNEFEHKIHAAKNEIRKTFGLGPK